MARSSASGKGESGKGSAKKKRSRRGKRGGRGRGRKKSEDQDASVEEEVREKDVEEKADKKPARKRSRRRKKDETDEPAEKPKRRRRKKAAAKDEPEEAPAEERPSTRRRGSRRRKQDDADGAVPPPKPAARRTTRSDDFIPLEKLRGCQDAIGYHFRDMEHLRVGLTHSSIKTENHPSNERMEFLGDSVLGHVVAEYLFQLLPDYDEGEMTKVKSVVVSTQGLAMISERLGLDKYLAVGRGIRMRGGVPQSLMANTFEAIVAAIYLDRGFESARLFILDNIVGPIEDCLANRHQKNYKSILQQIAQRDLNVTPTYKVLRQDGPEHSKEFEVVAVVGGYEFEPGWGSTKKDAEQRAAKAAVLALTQRMGRRAEIAD